LIASR
jgi:hypothetical protein